MVYFSGLKYPLSKQSHNCVDGHFPLLVQRPLKKCLKDCWNGYKPLLMPNKQQQSTGVKLNTIISHVTRITPF